MAGMDNPYEIGPGLFMNPDLNRPGPSVGVILAAGGSKRLGHPKQLIEIGGVPLIVRTVEAALGVVAIDQVIVVLGANADRIRPLLEPLEVTLIETSAWPDGLSQSIRTAVNTIEARLPGTGAALFTLCDQPHLDSAALTEITAAGSASTSSVVAAKYDNHPGAPCLIDRRHFDFLKKLEGDEGARSLFQKISPEDLTLVDLPQLSLDLDTPADLERWHRDQPDDD